MYEYFDEMLDDAPEDSLEHYGVLGMRWGIRRYQNYDGTLKAAGKRKAKTDRDKIREERKGVRAEKKASKEAAKAEKKAAQEEEAQKKLRSEIDNAVANLDVAKIAQLKGSMTTEDLKNAASRALALGQVGENLGKYQKALPKSKYEKTLDVLGNIKKGADTLKDVHNSLQNLKKEFGIDRKSLLDSVEDSSTGKPKDDSGPDIFDRIKETTANIAKDAASKANEKYQENKFQKDLKELKDRKKDNDTLDWLKSVSGSKTEQPKANFESPFKLKDGDYSVFGNSKESNDSFINRLSNVGNITSVKLSSETTPAKSTSSGKSIISSLMPKASSTPVSSVKPTSSSANIERILKKGAAAGDVSVADLTSDLLKKNAKSLGL